MEPLLRNPYRVCPNLTSMVLCGTPSRPTPFAPAVSELDLELKDEQHCLFISSRYDTLGRWQESFDDTIRSTRRDDYQRMRRGSNVWVIVVSTSLDHGADAISPLHLTGGIVPRWTTMTYSLLSEHLPCRGLLPGRSS
jgi:hypothetical protein